MYLLLKPQTSSIAVDNSRMDAIATTGEVTMATTSTVDKRSIAVYKRLKMAMRIIHGIKFCLPLLLIGAINDVFMINVVFIVAVTDIESNLSVTVAINNSSDNPKYYNYYTIL